MLTSLPILASPRYVRCDALVPAPITVFFNSTKFPILAPAPISEPGLIWANGPTVAPLFTTDPSITVESLIIAPSL